MTTENTPREIWRDILAVRESSPLVLVVGSEVTLNSTANALLALGASPAMSHAVREMDDMTSIANAVVIDMGSLNDSYVESMLRAGSHAVDKNIPVILDPVAVGASRLRLEAAQTLIKQCCPSVIRGNASEIIALSGKTDAFKASDSIHSPEEAAGSAMYLARNHSCVVCVSGHIDLVTDGTTIVRGKNGHMLMSRIRGLGCCTSAVIGAFLSVNPVCFQAALHGMAVMGMAGEIAAESSGGPGSFQMYLFDVLYELKGSDIARLLNVE